MEASAYDRNRGPRDNDDAGDLADAGGHRTKASRWKTHVKDG
jgi:hypothetical protein